MSKAMSNEQWAKQWAMSNEQWAMSNEQWAMSSEQGGVRSFRYFCFHQHSYFRLANIQPFPNPPTPRPFLFLPSSATSLLIAHCSLLIASHRYTATSLLTAHCSLLIASHRYTATSLLTAHCSLLIASHRHTATPPHRHVYTYPMSVKCKILK